MHIKTNKGQYVRVARWSIVLAAAITACNLVSAADPSDPSGWGKVYSIVVPYSNDNDLNALTRLIDHPYVDQKARTVSAEVGADELAKLQALGLAVRINEAETARIGEFIAERTKPSSAGQVGSQKISDGGSHSLCYRTVGQVYTTFDELAAKYPKLVKVQALGKTWLGTKYKKPGTDTADNSASSFGNLLAKYLPLSVIQLFNLSLFPEEPYPIKVIVAGNFEKQDAQAEKPPNMVWTGGIHAREYAPQEVGIKYIEWLLANYETDANARMMLDTNRYHFAVHNPDGRSIAEQQVSASQRKNTDYEVAACSTNASRGGVDLNRNYPFGWRTGGPGASDNKCAEDYRGTAPVSEPETQAVLDYVRGTWNQAACKWEGGALPDGRPKNANYCNAQNRDNGGAGEFDWKTGADENYGGGIFIDLHSNARAILWSWGVTRSENDGSIQTPNNLGLATIAQRLAYHNKYSAQQVLGYDTEGTTKDAIYGYLGAPSYTVEMGRSFYETCDNFNKEVYPENFNGFHYLSRILYRPYQLPQGPDTVDVKIAADAIPVGAKAAVTATVDDNRYLYSKPGQSDIPAPPVPVIKSVKTAMAYIDKLPWEAGAVGIPLTLMASAEASAEFPEATKTASGMLDTTGLVAGRHRVYVQGTNDDGKPGSVSAAFLNVKAADTTTPPTGGDTATPPAGGAIVMPFGKRGGGGSLGWGDFALVLLGLAGVAGARRKRG
jgi:carboxypeptidase T